MIEGVKIKLLTTHPDERGFFREVIRVTDDFFAEPFGQLSHSLVNQGVIKAWHGHRQQAQWNYVVSGLIRVALHDSRPDSLTYRETMEFLAGEGEPSACYYFPPGVLHGYRCVRGPMHIIYVTSGVYDPTDEVRILQDDAEIDFDWLTEATE
jgi:dTDP-4-dehydrorhamnose 3,5-epimerase